MMQKRTRQKGRTLSEEFKQYPLHLGKNKFLPITEKKFKVRAFIVY